MEGGTPQALNGPLWWYLVFMYVVAVGFAVYVSIDSRRDGRAQQLVALREPAWIYRWFQPVFLALVIVALLPVLPRIWSVIPVGLTPIAIAGQVAYLLRVVFPKS